MGEHSRQVLVLFLLKFSLDLIQNNRIHNSEHMFSTTPFPSNINILFKRQPLEYFCLLFETKNVQMLVQKSRSLYMCKVFWKQKGIKVNFKINLIGNVIIWQFLACILMKLGFPLRRHLTFRSLVCCEILMSSSKRLIYMDKNKPPTAQTEHI